MKIFGTVFPFVEKDEDSLKEGRYVANLEFLCALLTHGTFDEFHFFCLSRNHLDVTRRRIEKLGLSPEQCSRIHFFSIVALPQMLQSTDYHVFHQGGWGYFLASLSYLRLRYARSPFPITGVTHSLNGMDTPSEALRLCSAPLLPCDTVICTSRGARAVMEKTFAAVCGRFGGATPPVGFSGSLTVIPLGTGMAGSVVIDKIEARIAIRITPDAFVITSVGRFSADRKMDLYPLLLAVKHLCAQNTGRSIRLVLAGGDDQRQAEKARMLARDMGLDREVVLLGKFDNALKIPLYSASDVFVSISDNLQETFGLAVIEAMMCGVPPVISDFDGYRDLVEDGVSGFLIPTAWTGELPVAELADIMNFDTMQLILAQGVAVDTSVLERRIQELLDNHGQREQMGKSAACRASERYSWKAVIACYEQVWDAGKLSLQGMAWKNDAGVSNPFVHRYLDTFSHYPASLISETTRVSLLPEGESCLRTGRVPPMWGDIETQVPSGCVQEILGLLERSGVMRVIEIAHHVSAAPTGSSITYMILWMAKYGLVALE